MTKENRWILPPPSQVGVVVKDLGKAIDYYSRTFGLGPFQTIEFAPAKHWVKALQSLNLLEFLAGRVAGNKIELRRFTPLFSPAKKQGFY